MVGRSMVRNMGIAAELGYLHVPDGVLVDVKKLDSFPDDQVVLICTGSQGEPMAALSRMANRDHRIDVGRGDTVLLASSLIPGNENAVYRVINGLMRLGANVVHKGNAKVHVSGHASAGELLYCYNIVKPRNVMPVHGEWRHLVANAELAVQTGVAARARRAGRGRRRRRPRRRACASVVGAVAVRLRLRRRLVGRRARRGAAQGPPHPARRGLHHRHRRASTRPPARSRPARRSTPAGSSRTRRSSSQVRPKIEQALAEATGNGVSDALRARAGHPPRDRQLGRRQDPAPADDHPGGHRGVADPADPVSPVESAGGGRGARSRTGWCAPTGRRRRRHRRTAC